MAADKKIHREGIEHGNYKDGICYIVETIIEINKLTRRKDFSNIAIGTDFDGFAYAPRDMYVPSMPGALIDEIKIYRVV